MALLPQQFLHGIDGFIGAGVRIPIGEDHIHNGAVVLVVVGDVPHGEESLRQIGIAARQPAHAVHPFDLRKLALIGTSLCHGDIIDHHPGGTRITEALLHAVNALHGGSPVRQIFGEVIVDGDKEIRYNREEHQHCKDFFHHTAPVNDHINNAVYKGIFCLLGHNRTVPFPIIETHTEGGNSMQTSLTVHSRQQRRERTHARIKSSLLQLMSEKSFEDITVTELAQEAGINRKTIYSHFEGMDAVLAEVEDDFVGQIFGLWLTGQPARNPQILKDFFRMLGNELILNQQNMRLLILSGEHNRLLIKIKDRIIQLLIQSLDQAEPVFDREQFLYAAEFISGGMMAVLEQWAANPREDSLVVITELIQRNAEHIGELLYLSSPLYLES